MLKIENLSFRYGKHSPDVLRGVNMTLHSGEVGILLGRNGAGKTTLFQNLLGLCKPQGGRIFFDGEDITNLPPRQRAKKIAYVPQDIRFGSLSVFDSVLMGRVPYFGLRPGQGDLQATENILAQLQLADVAGENVNRLSGGQRQKVAIARALVAEPRLLILDEPTGNLDIANGQRMMAQAGRLAKERGLCILSSLHDLNSALAFGDRFFLMKDGQICHAGGEEMITAETLQNTFDAEVRVITYEGQKMILGGLKK